MYSTTSPISSSIRAYKQAREPDRAPKMLEREWLEVKDNIQDCYNVWNRKRRIYSCGNVALIVLALMLSSFAIPYTSFYGLNDINVFAGLAISGIIGFQTAFAIGEKARFYGQIVCELWAVDEESKKAMFDDVDDHQQLEHIETELRKLIEHDARDLPTGQGLSAIRQVSQTN